LSSAVEVKFNLQFFDRTLLLMFNLLHTQTIKHRDTLTDTAVSISLGFKDRT